MRRTRIVVALVLVVLIAMPSQAQQPVAVVNTPAVTNSELDIALSALRDAIIGSGPKTLTDIVNALNALTVTISGTVNVNCASGCSGTSDTDDGSIAAGQTTGLNLGLTQVYDGAVWQRLTFGQANMTASVPVVIAADQPALFVQGTVNVNGSVQVTSVTGSIMVEQPTGTSLHAVIDAGTVTVDDGGGSLTVDGPLTDAQLRNSAVPISAVALPLPFNAAAEDGGWLQTIALKDFSTETTLATLNGKVPALGQALAAGSVPVVLTASQLTTLTPPAAITGFATSGKQDTGNGSLASIDGKITAVNTGAVVVSSSALPSLAATSTKQSDGSQKTQVVDGSGNVIGATSNALDVNIKSGNPTTITATQATGTNLHVVVDTAPTTAVTGPLTDTQLRATPVPISGTVTATTGGLTDTQLRASAVPVSLATAPTTPVTNAGLTNLDVLLSTRTKPADQQHAIIDSGTVTAVTAITNALPAGSNVIGHVVADSGSTTAVTGNVTAVQATGSNLHVVVDTAPSTAVTNANLDVALSTLATASAQTTGNNSLATIATNTGNGATAANQTTGNSSLSTIATNTTNIATAARQDTGNASLATVATNTTTLASVVTTDNGSASATGVQIMGVNPKTGTAQPIATTSGGALWVQSGTVLLPSPPCNPVRRINCSPRTF